MRLWGQSVATGGNEIWLVEAVSGLETIEPLAPRCGPRFSTTFPSSSRYRVPVRRSYEVGAEISEPSGVDTLSDVRWSWSSIPRCTAERDSACSSWLPADAEHPRHGPPSAEQ